MMGWDRPSVKKQFFISASLIFFVKIYWGLTRRTFQEEQLAEQFGYLIFSLYLVFFRTEQSKKLPCTHRVVF